MISNYLKVALREFLKQRLFTLINVIGLGAGLACCLLISLFVRHEMSYDRHYAYADRIYRVSRDLFPPSGAPVIVSANSGPAAELLKESFPEIQQTARLISVTNLSMGTEDFVSFEPVRFVDASFFEIFDLEWKAGSFATALSDPASVVLTESLARKYFGDSDPMGKTLVLENRLPALVTGIVADLPANTHLSAAGFASLSLLEPLYGADGIRNLESWFSFNAHTYVLLQRGATPDGIRRELDAFSKRYVPQGGFSSNMRITALKDIHLAREFTGSLKLPGDRTTIGIFSAIAICILLIAGINFVNLAAARSSRRMLEVGMRKVLGASRTQLVAQFVGESICLTALALLLALIFCELLEPALSSFLGYELTHDYLREPYSLFGLLVIALVLGIVIGLYPAFSLSAAAPAQALKGERVHGGNAVLMRNTLVILQFVAAIVLIVATAVIYSQMAFINKLDLGFRTDQMVTLTLPNEMEDQWISFRERLSVHPAILNISSSDSIPLQVGERGGARKQGEDRQQLLQEMSVDTDFFDTYQIEFLAGRPFSPDITSDRSSGVDGEGNTGSLILNERLAREFGWSPDEALGQGLEHEGAVKTVIGVVTNTIESARLDISPILFQLPQQTLAGNEISIRISGQNLDTTMEFIDAAWRESYPGEPVVYRFLDSLLQTKYRQDRQHLELSSGFAGLSILIACLGLLALAMHNSERRTKEIGVRKVMGGSVWSIVLLLTNDFSKLVLIANVIAWPIAYVAMSRWLETFAYRIDLTSLIFIGSGLVALCIAWVTVGGTAAKAASRKPVLALRYE